MKTVAMASVVMALVATGCSRRSAPATPPDVAAARTATIPMVGPAAPPRPLLAAGAAPGFAEPDYTRHMADLKMRLPQGFSMVLARPFVVVGDSGDAQVRYCAEHIVQWAVTKLKAGYFTKDPDAIINVWLFKDKESYEKYTKEIFGDTPTTPYGYYSSAHNALIMNIATGGGTLVHEIVHPFMRANFPACPAWFNEGMGSLYEQSNERDGRIIGLTNWRLPIAQAAIHKGALPIFAALTATTDGQFYSDAHRGTNYAQARYLCYYLQEQGLLVKFYQQFTAHQKDDPTGYKTLQAVLGEQDMAAFQKRWETWVLTLRYER